MVIFTGKMRLIVSLKLMKGQIYNKLLYTCGSLTKLWPPIFTKTIN